MSEQTGPSPEKSVHSHILFTCGSKRYHQRMLTIGMKEKAANIGV
jgi:hypothetical protein